MAPAINIVKTINTSAYNKRKQQTSDNKINQFFTTHVKLVIISVTIIYKLKSL